MQAILHFWFVRESTTSIVLKGLSLSMMVVAQDLAKWRETVRRLRQRRRRSHQGLGHLLAEEAVAGGKGQLHVPTMSPLLKPPQARLDEGPGPRMVAG